MLIDREKSYIEEYNDFWKEIVENEDGTLNKDQVMRELSDYSMVMDNCARAYVRMTDGLISKQNTLFSEVESIFEDKFISKEYIVWAYPEDVIESMEAAETLEELKGYLIDLFELDYKKGK